MALSYYRGVSLGNRGTGLPAVTGGNVVQWSNVLDAVAVDMMLDQVSPPISVIHTSVFWSSLLIYL